MKKKTWRYLAEACVFVILLGALLVCAARLLERKASRNQFGPFLEKPQQYDVLFIGDSRFVNCLFPMELWADYGIAGYNLSCYGNTMPVNYWSMMNALDYASPKAVVLAVNDVHKDIKVTGSSSDLHTALDFFPLSVTKLRAIADLTDEPNAVDDDGNRYADMRWEYIFTLGKYHSRWSELSPGDFTGRPNVQGGADMMVGVAQTEDYSLIDDDRYAEETGVGYTYLRRIIEECQSRGIEILLVQLPYIASENAQMHANTVSSIAEEYGVNYLNLVSMDSVVDYAVDCYDQQAHLNPSGGWKVTDFLGAYLAEHYALADRRGDLQYADWANAQQAYDAYKLDTLRAQEKAGDLLMFLHDDSFSVRIAVRAQAQLYWDDQLITLLHNMVREHVHEPDAYSMWSNAMYPLDGLEDALWSDETYFLSVDRGQDLIEEYVGEDALDQAQRCFGADVWQEGRELRIQVLDRASGEPVLDRQF